MDGALSGTAGRAGPGCRANVPITSRDFAERSAMALQSKGDLAGAEPLLRSALEIAERDLGPEHPDTAGSLNNLASLLESKEDYASAELLYRRALAIAEKTLGQDDARNGHGA